MNVQDGIAASNLPMSRFSWVGHVTMNGTTAVTMVLTPGAYVVYLASADPAIVALGSFGTANPALPASGATPTEDLQIFPAGQVCTLQVHTDGGYNVELSAAGTPALYFCKIR
jgi:hypothetical protein